MTSKVKDILKNMSKVVVETTTTTYVWDTGRKRKLKESKVRETYLETDMYNIIYEFMMNQAKDIIEKEEFK